MAANLYRIKFKVTKRDIRLAGLRERQRRERHTAIVETAGRLFEANGYDATTMEDIANEVGMSTPTIYNYFRAKSDILLSLLEMDKALMEQRIEKIIRKPPDDPVDAVFLLIKTDLLYGYDATNKRIWRLISAAALQATDEARQNFVNVQSVFIMKVERLLRTVHRIPDSSVDPDLRALARTINALTRDAFRTFLLNEAQSVDEMLDSVRAQLMALRPAIVSARNAGTAS